MFRNFRALLIGALALRAIGAGPSAGADDPRPPSPAKDGAPSYIFLQSPADLDALRKGLARPDFVIIKGAEYDALKHAARPPLAPRRAVVESVALGGEVLDDLTHMVADYSIHLSGDEPAWVPIRLDGQVVTGAREGNRDLLIRSDDGGWQVQLTGEGAHRVQVALSSIVLSVRGIPEGRRLEWAIPEAGSTRISLVMAANVEDVTAGGAAGIREPLSAEPIEGGQRGRISAFLTPRKALEIRWKVPADAAAGPPLVTAQGEIALEVERGSMRARSSWEVRSERGTVRRLELRIDPADELVGLECDGRPVGVEDPGDPGSGIVAVPLSEPLKPGRSARLIVTTRRALSPESAMRLSYRGVPLLNVVSQSGSLAISQSGGDPWVSAAPGRGLRSIDPRTELPAGLRARPSIVMAYQFVEQPFDLGLQVDPSPPWQRVETRTSAVVDLRRARLDMSLDYNISRGKVFEVLLSLPDDFTLDSVGPEAVVAASQTLSRSTRGGRSVLAVRLTPRASEEGRFTLRLAGSQALSPGTPAHLGLPRPVDAQVRGGLIAVLAARDLSVSLLPNRSGGPSDFASAGQDVPASWPWPPGSDPGSRSPALWLRHDEMPAEIGLQVSELTRVVGEETTLDAIVQRTRVDVRQESTLRTQFGVLSQVDVAVPSALEASWELEGTEVARRAPLPAGDDGSSRYRLTLARPSPDLAVLRIRIRQPLVASLEPDRPTTVTIPRVTLLGTVSAPARVRVGSDEGIELRGDGEGWSGAKEEGPPTAESITPWRLEKVAREPVALVATRHAFASLPRLVASQLAIRSVREADGGVRTTASYRLEMHEGSLPLSLPAGARWVGARVAGESVTEVISVDKTTGAYQLKLPSIQDGPLFVSLEYIEPATSVTSNGGWRAPRLPEHAVVEECTWEVHLPAQLALAGVPDGWTDENEWFWNTYAFMRRPARAVGHGREDGFPVAGTHSYLFSRVGGPIDLAPRMVPRAALLGACSGSVLGIGLLAMAARRWVRRAMLVIISGSLIAAVVTPPSLIPLIAQSSLLGFVLLAVAKSTRAGFDRRGLHDRRAREPSVLSLGASPSAQSAVSAAGSDESTIVRKRVGTTIERVITDAPDALPASATG